MKPPVIRTDTGKVAASMLAGWGLDWADTIAMIESEAIALGPAMSDDPLPAATWFRLRWTTGRVGKWHRAGGWRPRIDQQFCRCGRSVRGYGGRSAEIVIGAAGVMPLVGDRCNAWRKAVR